MTDDTTRRPDLGAGLRLMGLSEIAKVLHVHWREVRELVETGQLPVIRVGATGEPKIALATLEAWLRRLGEAGADRSAMGIPLGNPAAVLGKPGRSGEGSRRSARADRGAA
jgi:excisionase family DNA binding protein